MTLLHYNGKELKTIDRGFSDHYYTSIVASSRRVSSSISAYDSYEWIADVFKCVTVRKNEIARIPIAIMRDGEDVGDDPIYKPLRRELTKNIRNIETSLCLAGAGYLLKQTNDYGVDNGLRFVLPDSMTPLSDKTRGLYGFKRDDAPYDLDRVVYVWNENMRSEVAPGRGEVEVALAASGVLYSIDSMIASYFNGGAVKVTVFPVAPGTDEAEVKNFQSFLNRRLSSVVNAFKNIVVKFNVAPIVIGSDLKDTLAAEMVAIKQNDIAKALSVPTNLINGTYKYKTADSEYLNFMVGTMIPRLDSILDELNEQYYTGRGIEIVSKPERMEIMQASQLEQVGAVVQLYDRRIIGIDRALEILGESPREMIEAKPADAMDGEDSADTAPMPDAVMPISPSPKSIELKRWERKAINALEAGRVASVPFASDIILADEHAEIKTALESCATADDVRGVFSGRVNVSRDTVALERSNELLAQALKVLERD